MKKPHLLLALSLMLGTLQVLAQTACIAHRGHKVIAPENSLEAMISARLIRADGMEFDVRHTSDGVPILMHDKTLNRTVTHRPGRVCPLDTDINRLTYRQIRNNCILISPFYNTPVPSLYEALKTLKDSNMYVFVEFKDRPSSLTKRIIQNHFAEIPHQLRIISFKLAYYSELLALPPYDALMFWTKVRFLNLQVTSFRANPNHGVNLHQRGFNPRRLRNFDNEISVWTVNSPEAIHRFISQGVDFITTGNVEACLEQKAKFQHLRPR